VTAIRNTSNTSADTLRLAAAIVTAARACGIDSTRGGHDHAATPACSDAGTTSDGGSGAESQVM